MRYLLTNQSGIAAIMIAVFIVLGVVVVGVGAAAVVLSDHVSITLVNRTGGTLDIAKGTEALNLNFLPGIKLPSQIAQGDTALVQIPRRLVDSVNIANGSVEVHAFSRSFTIGTSSIDMQRSTLDGAPLSGFVGRQIDLKRDHTLVLMSR